MLTQVLAQQRQQLEGSDLCRDVTAAVLTLRRPSHPWGSQPARETTRGKWNDFFCFSFQVNFSL